MIDNTIYIKDYDWVLHIISDCDCSANDYIVDKLRLIGCNDGLVNEAVQNLKTCAFNIGLTYSNRISRESLMVVCKTSSRLLLINTFSHECYHLISHIGVEDEEQGATLMGNIMGRLWSIIRKILNKY